MVCRKESAHKVLVFVTLLKLQFNVVNQLQGHKNKIIGIIEEIIVRVVKAGERVILVLCESLVIIIKLNDILR